MSLILTYQEKQNQLNQLQEELRKLENDEKFKSELEFKNKLESLMSEFDKSARDVLSVLQPEETKQTVSDGRKKRKLKVYKNPNTGEVIETRGGNHKTLKAWKEEYGAETVEGWLQ